MDGRKRIHVVDYAFFEEKIEEVVKQINKITKILP